MRAGLDDIETTLRRELSIIKFLVLNSQEQDRFEPPQPLFGPTVGLKFPSIAYEISEAGKCLALDRSTASAFHSVRALEAAIRALSKCLGIADPTRAIERTWGKVLRSIKDEIDKRWPPNLIRGGGDDDLFDNAYAALAGMQNPWRNATMHLDQIYTPDDARDIFNGVGAFMRKLASRMDEDGLPLA